MKRVASVLLILGLALTACAEGSGLSERESGALLGSGLGAGLGAIVGHQTGHAGAGTAIGAATGALAGGLAGEGMRRTKESAKEEIRQEMMQQQYQQGYAPQYAAAPQYATPQVARTAAPQQEVHTKYNPRTGLTFPEQYQFDPATGEELKYIR
ncbi:MAG: hypothetical protein A3J52_03465 [Omnitrophica bacterium RIFCSPHIGHO2_02_FULL_49_9]|nr:MAG: hypothetical protein A3J52_03465 [Omnitrophica bacterium RIFCSPHIGHO2_02_FULL_49_9]OGW89476.1 MAG: hypothetical protein A3A73_05340 [Omnitrophica bacterium RIFCSPLOWO2_01_FULL_50_24]